MLRCCHPRAFVALALGAVAATEGSRIAVAVVPHGLRLSCPRPRHHAVATLAHEQTRDWPCVGELVLPMALTLATLACEPVTQSPQRQRHQQAARGMEWRATGATLSVQVSLALRAAADAR